MSLAGTKTADKTWTPKELDEQKIVTDSILEGLTQTNCKNINADGPQTIQAGKVQHLKTAISATLETPNKWAEVIRILHPTPAVCGLPKSKALTYIPQLEKHNRQFYTGFVGIINAHSKHLFVNLRCMQHYNGFAKLYLGGGITAGSNQDDEWNETEKKGMTLATIL